MKTLLILLLVATANAETMTQPKDKASSIYESIAGKSESGSSISCPSNSDDCTITYTLKEGETLAGIDDVGGRRAALLAELGILEDKLDAGTITSAELRRVIRIMMKLTRYSKAGL